MTRVLTAKKIAKFVEKYGNDYEIVALSKKTPITISEEEMAAYKAELNRHHLSKKSKSDLLMSRSFTI